MYSSDELFQRSRQGYLGVYFPNCEATREIDSKITLVWAQKHFVTRVHTLFYILHDITNPQMTIKTTIITHRPRVSLAGFSFCWWRHNRLLMTSRWPDNCDAITRRYSRPVWWKYSVSDHTCDTTKVNIQSGSDTYLTPTKRDITLNYLEINASFQKPEICHNISGGTGVSNTLVTLISVFCGNIFLTSQYWWISRDSRVFKVYQHSHN